MKNRIIVVILFLLGLSIGYLIPKNQDTNKLSEGVSQSMRSDSIPNLYLIVPQGAIFPGDSFEITAIPNFGIPTFTNIESLSFSTRISRSTSNHLTFKYVFFEDNEIDSLDGQYIQINADFGKKPKSMEYNVKRSLIFRRKVNEQGKLYYQLNPNDLEVGERVR